MRPVTSFELSQKSIQPRTADIVTMSAVLFFLPWTAGVPSDRPSDTACNVPWSHVTDAHADTLPDSPNNKKRKKHIRTTQ